MTPTVKRSTESHYPPINDVITSQPPSNSDPTWNSVPSQTGSSGFAKERIATRSLLSSEILIGVRKVLPATSSIPESVASCSRDALPIQLTSKHDPTKTGVHLQASSSALIRSSIATQSVVTLKALNVITEVRPTRSSISENDLSSSRNALTILPSSNPPPTGPSAILQESSSALAGSSIVTEGLQTSQRLTEILKRTSFFSRISESSSSSSRSNALTLQPSSNPNPVLSSVVIQKSSLVVFSSNLATESFLTSQTPNEVLEGKHTSSRIFESISTSSNNALKREFSWSPDSSLTSSNLQERYSSLASSSISTESIVQSQAPSRVSEATHITPSIAERVSSSSQDIPSIEPFSNQASTGLTATLEENCSVVANSNIATNSLVASLAPSNSLVASLAPSEVLKAAHTSSSISESESSIKTDTKVWLTDNLHGQEVKSFED